MTLRTAILALAPTIYWPMDDPTGPAAADATGNGHSGFFTANTRLQAPGPEAGTFAVATAAAFAGVQLFGANPLTGTGPFSFLVWVALGGTPAGDDELIYNGLSDRSGEGLEIGSFGQIRIIRGGLEIVNADGLLTQGVWHMLAHTFQTSGNRITYLDGAAVDTHPAGVPTTVASTEWCRAFTPAPGLLAHAAFWRSVLTAGNIATIWAAGPGAGPLVDVAGAGIGSTSSFTDILAILAQILGAVRKTY